jgi:hypothetical protein
VYRNEEGRKICGEREGGGVWVTGWQWQRWKRERERESEATTVKSLKEGEVTERGERKAERGG